MQKMMESGLMRPIVVTERVIFLRKRMKICLWVKIIPTLLRIRIGKRAAKRKEEFIVKY